MTTCRCQPDCEQPCTGACGCKACYARYKEAVRRTVGSPATFGATADRKYVIPPHIQALDNALMDCIRTAGRLIVTMPPRHGKSMTCSTMLPAWYLGWHPENNVLLCGHGVKFASKFGRRCRSLVRNYGHLFPACPELSEESKAADEWELTAGGGLKCAGVGTGIAGMPANLLIIDDPIKGAKEARSETHRDNVWEWFVTEACTRLEPGAPVVLINTRWNEDDLAGRLLRGDSEEDWKEVRFPALAEENDPLGRAVGDPLWAARYDAESLERTRRRSGPYWWSSLYQQRPTPQEGGTFLRKWFQRPGSSELNTFQAASVPRDARFVRWWDKAATQGGGDYTAGVLLASKDDDLWVVDVTRGQWSAGLRDDVIDRTAQQDDEMWGRVVHWFEQEPGSGGKQSAEISAQRLNRLGYSARYEPASGSKGERADPLASDLENRHKRGEPVKLVNGPWTKALIDEMTLFPNGTFDDQVDACAGAYNKLAKRRIRLMFSTGAA